MLKSLRAFATSGFAPTASVMAVVGSLPIPFRSVAMELGALAQV